MSKFSDVYCDKVVCTSAPENFAGIGLAMNDLVESCGGKTVVLEDAYREIRMPEGGLVLLQQAKGWSRVSINGKACSELRLFKRFNEALGVIGSFPHKVTQLHAKLDYRSRSTPGLLNRLDKVALAGKLFGYDYQQLQSMPTMRPDRRISKNLYAPKVQAEIQRVYYDKTLERFKAGKLAQWSDDENLSVELRVSGRVTRAGLSLRDASEPSPLFWNYMGECPLIGKYRPLSVPEWSSVGSEYVHAIAKRSDDEKLNDYLRFGGCWMMVAKLSSQLGRGDDFLKEVQRQLRKHQPVLEGV
jgi:hypothetical protein